MLRSIAWMVLSLPLLAGCGDLTSAESDQGLLRFTLVTDYEVPEGDLRDATIVAGHWQRFDVDLTQKGAAEIDDPSALTYEAAPNATVELSDSGDEDDPPDMRILVDGAAPVRIDALIDGAEIDGIDFDFDEAASLELSVRVRTPWEGDFDAVPTGETTTVTEGSQATFLPIPLDAAGDRLAGDIETEVTADPQWAVVPGVNVNGVWEDGYWTSSGEIDFYFIDPADVTITVTDTVSGGQGEHRFTVEPVDTGM